MRNAIIVHGKPSKEIYYSADYPTSSNFAWIPWLQKQLVIKDIKADAPEMPFAYEPEYPVWCQEFERFDITPTTMLIGHSAGGGFLVRWLSEHPDINVDKVALVAPSIDPDRKSLTGFCDFVIDTKLAERVNDIVIFVSDGDSEGIHKSVQILQDTIPELRVIVLPGHGHFIPAHMGGSVEFPELADYLLSD